MGAGNSPAESIEWTEVGVFEGKAAWWKLVSHL